MHELHVAWPWVKCIESWPAGLKLPACCSLADSFVDIASQVTYLPVKLLAIAL